MNLTYDNFAQACACDACSGVHARVARMFNSEAGKQAEYLDRSTVSAPNLNGLGIIPLMPLVGAGAKAVLPALASKLLGKGPSARTQGNLALGASSVATMNDYKSMMGSAPGRAIGIGPLKEVLASAITTGDLFSGGAPPLPDISRDVAQNVIYSVGGRCSTNGKACGRSMMDEFNESFNKGVRDPRVMADNYSRWGVSSGNTTWGSPLMRQMALDIFDALLADRDSSAPLVYANQPAAPSQPSAAPQLVAIPQMSVASQSVPNVAVPQGPTLATVVSSQSSNAIDALLAQLNNAGASQSEMFKSALAALNQKGVNTNSPIVQAATQQAVQQASGPSPWLIAGGVAAGLGLLALVLKGRRR